ncbi:MAG: PspC domain-containing protein [Oscillochloris sp.]|nr:PspC domain-containing protein [Oscillochloris sp.]
MDTTRRITRSRTDRMVAGVAGGLAAYLNIDPMILRIAFVVLALINGFGAVLYLALWLIVPNEDNPGVARDNLSVAVGEMQGMVEDLVARVRSAFQR